jgi:hypothetical protein
MGFGTTRLVGKTLNKTGLSSTQMKGMSTLQNICGVKQTEKNDSELAEKIANIKAADEGHKKNKLFENIEEQQKSNNEITEIKISNTAEPKKKGFSLKNLNF